MAPSSLQLLLSPERWSSLLIGSCFLLECRSFYSFDFGAGLLKMVGTATAPACKMSDLSTFSWVEPAPPACPGARLHEPDGHLSCYFCGLQLEGLPECPLASQK